MSSYGTVLEVLRRSGDWLTPAEVSRRTGLTELAAQDTLDQIAAEGEALARPSRYPEVPEYRYADFRLEEYPPGDSSAMATEHVTESEDDWV